MVHRGIPSSVMQLTSCARISPVSDRFLSGNESSRGTSPPAEMTPDARVGSKADEDTLVRETLAGKRWAQKEVWCRFAPMVYGLLRRTLGSRHDHDDLMQEVFLRVFRRLHSLEKV